MPNAENEKLARRVIEDVWNEKQRDLIDDLFSEAYRGHGFGSEDGDLQAYKDYFDMITTAFPDVEFEIGLIFSDEEMVATSWKVTGTHEGELMGIEPTGNTSSVTGLSIDRIAGGKVVESWMNFDSLKMMQNIGAVPEMVPADD